MKSAYQFLENVFDRFSFIALKIFSSSITFILAVLLVIFWMFETDHSRMSLQNEIQNIILAITFLSFFIILKTQNRLSVAMHLKLNELVKAQENASDELLNAEKKSEAELTKLGKKFDEPDENPG